MRGTSERGSERERGRKEEGKRKKDFMKRERDLRKLKESGGSEKESETPMCKRCLSRERQGEKRTKPEEATANEKNR
jgi:hypothetical protein